ncbi:GAF and ANTAR domain-containing protein [Nocardioides sp. zg-DK7169]|uniref:GAF and ANTAR domain-containing protein n=1 Tax=Nocardioides sp. zg-DK7169 TaxID=2736600 RepID=UPI001555308F|nr:GAF and ANTAR domain-containing protein [Nocardioides sp. zg-DK7169]NPC98933.1 GAF and ANTAR domain-containing protein [Nocardioides sp. zg-DK7169]
MNSSSLQTAAALTATARELHKPRSFDETLDVVVRSTLQALPVFDHVGVSIAHRDGRVETLAGTDRFVWELDELQHRVGDGPGAHVIRQDPVVLVEHLRHDQRWPHYVTHAVGAGLRAQMCLRLYTEEDTLGALNLYSTSSETIDSESVQLAELFASHAATALARARREHDLQQALASRKVIGQALGILSERYRLDQERAFDFLARTSSTRNIKLRVLADEIVQDTNARYAAA